MAQLGTWTWETWSCCLEGPGPMDLLPSPLGKRFRLTWFNDSYGWHLLRAFSVLRVPCYLAHCVQRH